MMLNDFPIIPSRSHSHDQYEEVVQWNSWTPCDAAVYYASLGWPVFPVATAEKKPLLPNGFYGATTAFWQIVSWWEDLWPTAGIGLPTGQETGIVVLDIDAKTDPESGKSGFDSLAAFPFIYGYEPLPDNTLIARSGSGGRHYYFTYPPDTTHVKTLTRLAGFAGIDVRGDGGYIVAPPSLHQCGTYTWERWFDPGTLAVYPPFLMSLTTPRFYGPKLPLIPAEVKGGQGGDTTKRAKETPAEHWTRIARSIALRHAQIGNRNSVGFWLAKKVVEARLPSDEAIIVMQAYVETVPTGDHPYTLEEALQSLRSAAR